MTATDTRAEGAAAASDQGELNHRQIMVVLSGLLLCVFLAAVDGTIVSTALPTIAGDLGGFSRLSWVVTAYFLTSTAATPLFGKVSDLYGRRRVLQFALVVFLAGSMLAGISQNMTQLVLFRGLQGIGGGGLQSLAFIVLGDIMSPRERGRYMGYFTGTFALSGLAGPLLGGLVVDSGALGWRWIFYLNLPLGLVAFFVISTVLRRLPVRKVRHRIDWQGSLLMVTSVSSLLLGASLGGDEFAWGSPQIVGLFVAGVVLAVLFVVQERRAEEPVLPMRLFRDPIFAVGMAISFFVAASTMSANVYLPLFLQVVSGATATRSGLLLAPMMASLTVTSIFIGRYLSKVGRYRILLRTGPLVVLIGAAGLTLLSVSSKPWHAAPWMIVIGLGMGTSMPPLSIAIQNTVDYTDLGVATSANTFFRTLGQTFGVAILGTVLSTSIRNEVVRRVPSERLAGLDLKQLLGSPRAIRALDPDLRVAVVHSVAAAVHNVYLVAVPIAAVSVILGWFLKEKPLRTTSAMAEARAAAMAE